MLRIQWVSDRKLLQNSFKAVKNHVSELHVDVLRLEHELIVVKNLLNDIRNELNNQQNSQKISESQASLSTENLRQMLRKLFIENEGEALKQENTKAAEVFSVENNAENFITHTKTQKNADKLKEDLLKNYERNKKDIIKQQIIFEARSGNLTKITLRDVVVDQKKYCSKASFYRYLDELEASGHIVFRRRNKKMLIETPLEA